MKAVSPQTMRSLDASSIASGEVDGWTLMTQAAEGIAEAAYRRGRAFERRSVLIACGRGNNGGDGFAAARILFEKYKLTPKIVTPFERSDFSGDALKAYDSLPDELKSSISSDASLLSSAGAGSLILDALLGTGFRGEVKSPFTELINAVNSSGAFVLSADVPSGLDPDTGMCGNVCVTAHLTVTLELPKRGMLFNDGPRKCGCVEVVKLGISEKRVEAIADYIETTAMADFRSALPREGFDTWKNRRGHVLVVGGSRDYPSAPFLSAEAALRNGAGLVTAAVPASMEIICPVSKSLIVRRIPDGGRGCFSGESISEIRSLCEGKSCIVLGMGLSANAFTLEFVRGLLPSLKGCRCVLDADALNLLAQDVSLSGFLSADSVLTPHIGEFKRLADAFGRSSGSGDAADSQYLAEKSGAVIVRKGVRSLAVSPSGGYSVNLSGCPVLSTAGSGDVLSGIIGGMSCIFTDMYAASRFGVFVHGLAGEYLLFHGSHTSFSGWTSDDLSRLPLSEVLSFYDKTTSR